VLAAVADAASERLLDRPLRPRLRLSPGGLVRGELDMVKVEVPAFLVAGLVVDRFVIRADRVRITPGLPPRFRAGPVRLRAVVGQNNLDRWTRKARLPFALDLTRDGVILSGGVGGIRVTEVEVDLGVAGPLLQLRPRKATMLGMSAPLVWLLRGYLPLPPLPRGARLERVDHGDRELTASFIIDDVDEPLTPDVARRITSLLRVPIPRR
jgi:hypothetical protein